MRFAKKEPFPVIYVDSKDANDESKKYESAAKSQLKKIQKIWVRENYKAADKSKKEEEDAEKREKNLEEAKSIVLTEDGSLEPATRITIVHGEKCRNTRICVYGWVHRLRRQGKSLMFITLRDGTGYMQCVLTDLLCQTYNALVLTTESTVKVCGVLVPVPEGKKVSTCLFIYNKPFKNTFDSNPNLYPKCSLNIVRLFIKTLRTNEVFKDIIKSL